VSEKPIDTLRLTQRDRKLLTRDPVAQSTFKGADLRARTRHPFQRESGLMVQIQHPGGTVAQFLVQPRDLSSEGMCFLHGGFLYNSTRCIVLMPNAEGKMTSVSGQVVRCRLLFGRVHEIGMHFDEPLKLSNFVCDLVCDSPVGEGEGTGNSQQFQGTVLVVDDSVDDRELIRFVLGGSGLETVIATTGAQALKSLAQQRFDLIMVDHDLRNGMDGPELIRSIRERGIATPIIGMTADDNIDVTNSLTLAGASFIFAKPFALTELLMVLSMFLHGSQQTDQPLLSDHWTNPAIRPLILSFLERLESSAARVRAINDVAELRRAAMEIRSTCGSYGYPAITMAANRLIQQIDADAQASIATINKEISELMTLCQSACGARRNGKTT
jgi:CheY-like chemotaxis protein